MSDLLKALLAKPVGPVTPPRETVEKDFTRQIEITRDTITATLRERVGVVNEGTALAYLQEEGQDPDDWEVTNFRKLKWGPPDSPYESVKFSFKRKASHNGQRIDISELIAAIDSSPRGEDWEIAYNGDGSHTFIVALGDMQFGKIDGDGPAGTLQRTIDCINAAADRLELYRLRFGIGHVHIAWLGDHIEGFLSQGGANVFRTTLTLNEQIRLTRRVMLHAMLVFAPLCGRLTMAAVPGNHGETARFAGKGVTRYDDSHDTEALIAVKDAADLNPERFGHVEFFVPETDEMTVVVNCSGTVVAHAHGHQWRVGKALEWWKGQAFNRTSAMHQADLLLAGHLHHELVMTDGPRTFVQVPSMENESTWYRHATGTVAASGLMVLVTKDGVTNVKESVPS